MTDTNRPQHSRSRRHVRLTPTVIARRELERRALELRTQNYTYQQIASELGLANRGMAAKYVARILDRHEVETVDEYRRVMGEQLDAVGFALWPQITGPRPSVAAIDRYLQIHDRRTRLLGLDQSSPRRKDR